MNEKEMHYNDLIIRLNNTELENEILREKLYLLTGCRGYGSIDGMNGACIECYYEDKELNDRCMNFSHEYRNHWKNYCENKIKNNKNNNNIVDVNLSF